MKSLSLYKSWAKIRWFPSAKLTELSYRQRRYCSRYIVQSNPCLLVKDCLQVHSQKFTAKMRTVQCDNVIKITGRKILLLLLNWNLFLQV